ncbi:MAG: OmpH family outer membrane protein [Pseudomonadota bacterium]
MSLQRVLAVAPLACLILWASLSASPTLAQSDGDTVLIIDMSRLLREAEAAQRINVQADELRKSFNLDIEQRRAALRAEEEELVALRESLPRDAFDQRVASFEERVRLLKRDARELSSRLQRAVSAANEQLRRAATTILVQIMNERGARVMLEKRDIILSANDLEVTDEVIRRLDAANFDISLEILESPDQ